MRRFVPLFCLLFFAFGTASASARQINLPAGNPIMGIDLPADWKAAASKRGIEVRSPDEEVFFWVEIYLPADKEAVTNEHQLYFARQGVEITGEPRTSRNTEGSVKVQATDFPATWKGKPTILRYLAVDPGLPAGNLVLLSYWASPQGDKMHDAVFRAVLKSLGPPK